jgi:hypothetical protein
MPLPFSIPSIVTTSKFIVIRMSNRIMVILVFPQEQSRVTRKRIIALEIRAKCDHIRVLSKF